MFRLLVICLIFGCIVAGAGVVAWSMGGREQQADFTFINRGDHKTLDPGLMSWLQDMRVAYAMWEGLYTLDPKTLTPVPGVADRYEVDPTRTIYKFHLRPDARWSNGDPVTSHDFDFAWRRILEQPGDYTFLHYYVKGAGAYADAYAKWVDQADSGSGMTSVPPPDYHTVGIETPDDQTFIVHLRSPIPFFLSLCAFPPFFPLNEKSMRQFATVDPHTGRVSSYDEGFTRPPYLVSNGPYRMAEWLFKRRIRMVANDYYWNRGEVRSRVVDELNIDDPTAGYRAYRDGRVDLIMDVDENLVGEMRRAGGGSFPGLHIFSGFGTYYWVLNCQAKLPDGSANPLYDRRVRRALVMAIDRRPIIDNILKANEKAATHYIPPGIFPGYVSPPGIPYDPAEARRLMAEAGYPAGVGFPRLQMIFNQEFTQHKDIAEILRSQWEQELGLHFEIQALEIKVFATRLFARDFALARGSWIGDYPDPTTFTDKFLSGNDDNSAGWVNPQYDALCAKAEKETDQPKRLALLSQAEEIFIQDAAIVPIYHYSVAYLFRPSVTGIGLDPREALMIDAIHVDR
ncbi:MAG TPA: peptide ABC transporter substrate-binding protein [Tepidisphaeraceae bacterium]|nr:peptide ABC transporter substrate-binding protein [Tepidisphaeraceae bacterium]